MNFKSHISLFTLFTISLVLFGYSYMPANSKPSKPLLPIETTQASNGLVSLSAGLNAEYYLVPNDPNTAYLYLEVKTGEYKAVGERSPLNLSLVIDKSGSMIGNKLQYAKKAAQFVAENLSSSDYISLVTYDNHVLTNWMSAAVKDKEQLQNVINAISAGGSTNLGAGMLEGYTQAKNTFNQNITNRVLLLSDGLANQGITNQAELEKIASEKNQELGISISTFGIGAGYNEDLMQGLAENGSGNYYFIQNAEDIPSIFKKEMDGLLSVVAQNAKLSLSLPSGISVEQVFGFMHQQEGQELSIQFRDLFAGETKAVLLKLHYPANASASLNIPITLNYTNATCSNQAETLNAQVQMNFTQDASLASESVNKEIEQWITLYESNYLMEKAIKEVDKGNYQEAEKTLQSNTQYLDTRKDAYGSNEMLERQDSLSVNYEKMVEKAESMPASEINIMQKTNKSLNYSVRKRK